MSHLTPERRQSLQDRTSRAKATDNSQTRSPDKDRPNPRKPPERTTLWLDLGTGAGVDDAGRDVLPMLGGRRKKPTLVDLLTAALHHHADRIIVCGTLPDDPTTWLHPPRGRTVEQFLPDWTQRSVYTGANPTGRFTHTDTDRKVTVLTANEWFKVDDITPAQARWAHRELTDVIATAIDRKWPLLDHIGATGINIWKRYVPSTWAVDRMDKDLGKLILATDPQHRFEHFVDGPARCDCGDCPALIPAGTVLPAFTYCDGRFMYGAVKREIGAAPATFLSTSDAQALFASNPYWPARYLARFTVPEGWSRLGLLAVKRESGTGWHWPNRPGAQHNTWADTEELHLAATHGWTIEILEGIKLSKIDSLSPYATAIEKMLSEVERRWATKPAAGEVLSSAIKQMYRVTIGQFAARQPLTTITVPTAEEIPEGIASFHADRNAAGDIISYTYEMETHTGDPDSWHPEIAARLWALSRLRVLSTPTALKTEDGKMLKAGAITIPPGELIGIQGDAIYTSVSPLWTFPAPEGGGDDGRTGRIRIKGLIPDPVNAPATREARQQLSDQAELWWTTNGGTEQ